MSNLTNRNNPFGFLDNLFDDIFPNETNSKINQIMRTDIKDNGDNYEFEIELPAIKKEDIKLLLEDGYLTVEASQEKKNEEKGNYIHKERYYGSYKRSFYVGEEVKNEDIKASLNDGILRLIVNKREPEEEKPTYIEIE